MYMNQSELLQSELLWTVNKDKKVITIGQKQNTKLSMRLILYEIAQENSSCHSCGQRCPHTNTHTHTHIYIFKQSLLHPYDISFLGITHNRKSCAMTVPLNPTTPPQDAQSSPLIIEEPFFHVITQYVPHVYKEDQYS